MLKKRYHLFNWGVTGVKVVWGYPTTIYPRWGQLDTLIHQALLEHTRDMMFLPDTGSLKRLCRYSDIWSCDSGTK